MMRPTLLAFLSALFLAACASSPDGPPLPPAADAYRVLEVRLLTANEIDVAFAIESSGAVVSDFTGTLRVEGHDHAMLEASGTFQGEERHLELAGDGDFLTGGSEAGRFEMPAPLALAEGLMIGCTRMGLLHNLAMLSAGAPPDGTDGAARSWVRLENHAWAEKVGGGAISFDIVVADQPVGSATVWLDVDGLPTRREQKVEFPGGTMRVTETYEIFYVH